MEATTSSNQRIDRLSSLPNEVIQFIFDLAFAPGTRHRSEPISKRLTPLQRSSLCAAVNLWANTTSRRFATFIRSANHSAAVRKLTLSAGIQPRVLAKHLGPLLPQFSGLVVLDVSEMKQASSSFWCHLVQNPSSFANLRDLNCVILSEWWWIEEEEEDFAVSDARIRGVRPLRHLPQLRKLSVRWNEDIKVSHAGTRLLPRVTRLVIYGFGAGEVNNLALISACPALVELALGNYYYCDLLPVVRTLPPSIRDVAILSPADLDEIARLSPPVKNLTRLGLLSTDLLPENLADLLVRLPSVQRVTIGFTFFQVGIVEDVFRSLPRLPNLREIELDVDLGHDFENHRVDLTPSWFKAFRSDNGCLDLEYEGPGGSGEELAELVSLVSEATEKGIRVDGNLDRALEAGTRYIVEANNRAIVKAVALGRPPDFETVWDEEEDYGFELPKYEPEFLEADDFFVVKRDLPEQQWFLLELQSEEPFDPKTQGTLDKWLGIVGKPQ